jgi:energy-coupling factor transporter ATP-binding protein EcfA2
MGSKFRQALRSSTRVEKLTIEKFRAFAPRTDVFIGEKITLIAGQNGTAKSTILGMISQPLGFPSRAKDDSQYTTAYHGIELLTLKTITGEYFKAEYSEIFSMSAQFDPPQEHKYAVFVVGEKIIPTSRIVKQGLVVTSEARKDQKRNHLRVVTNSDTRAPGEGNFPHPVIFKGLERLRPLAKCEKITTGQCALEAEDRSYWKKNYKRILNIPPNEQIESEEINTGNAKGIYQSIRTEKHDSLGASAGQDNVGQLLTAIISFRKLKRQLGDRYQGGLLLVDELDASLHPTSQEILFRVLSEACNDLSLQVVATTHSLTLLEFSDGFKPNCSKLVYLRKRGGIIEVINEVDFDFINIDLASIRKPKKRAVSPDKTTILFEDNVGSEFFRQITGNLFSKYIKIHATCKNKQNTSFSNNDLKKLAESKIPEFRKIVYVLDPDSQKMANDVNGPILALPGGTQIERIIFQFLASLPDNDPAWERDLDCTQQECFTYYNDIEDVANVDIKTLKKWMRMCHNKKYFGANNKKVFQLWAKRNKDVIQPFCLKFLEALKKVRNDSVIDQLKHDIEHKFESAQRPKTSRDI